MAGKSYRYNTDGTLKRDLKGNPLERRMPKGDPYNGRMHPDDIANSSLGPLYKGLSKLRIDKNKLGPPDYKNIEDHRTRGPKAAPSTIRSQWEDTKQTFKDGVSGFGTDIMDAYNYVTGYKEDASVVSDKIKNAKLGK